MSSSSKPVNWQDWALIGLRVVFLLFIDLLLYTSRTAEGLPAYNSSDVTVALVVGIVATVVLIIPTLYPALGGAIPLLTVIGDWAMAATLTYASRGNPFLLTAVGCLIIIASVPRLGVFWGAVQAIGVLVSLIAVLGALSGFADLAQTLNSLSLPLLLVAATGVIAVSWAFALQRQVRVQAEQIAELKLAKAAQLEDMRERTRGIYEMTAALSSDLNYEKILDAAMSAGSLALRDLHRGNIDRLVCAVLLFRSKDSLLHVVTGRGLVRADEDRATPGTDGVIGAALKNCVPSFAGSGKKDPELRNFIAFQSCRSLLCIPLRAGYDNYGVLLFGSAQPEAFTEEHLEMLTAIGTQATFALQNAVLYENLINERDRIVEVEEEARKKLARDLHDGPTQSIAAIAMRMGIIGKMLERTPDEVPGELKKVEDLARRTTKEIRHMLFTLRPLVLENQGLSAALEQLAEKMQETHNQPVSVRVSKDVEKALDTHQQGTIFYIVEEAVGNARKHARASLINVNVYQQDDVAVVQIADNGVGFDTSAVEANYDQRGSLGMVNLRERTELLNGTLRIESALGRGTTVTVVVPLKDSPSLTSRLDRQARKLASTGSTTKLAAAAVDRIRAAQSNN